MSEHEAASVGSGDVRLAQLSGDRMCAKCAFNLNGQTVVREPHYGMLIVRCPECGAAAALQEYPLLGRWASRLGYIVAGLWLGAMMLLGVLSAVAVWRQAESVEQRLGQPLAMRLQAMWSERLAEEQRKNPQNANLWYGKSGQDWWNGLDRWEQFKALGGWSGGIGWQGLLGLLPAGLCLGTLGAMMAVCTPHARGRGRLVIGLLVVGLGAIFMLLEWLGTRAGLWGGSFMPYYYYGGVDRLDVLRPYLAPPCMVVCGVLYLLGLWWGRMLTRWLVVVFLPPRMRGCLSFLWLADGKPLPRGMGRV